MLHQQIYIKTDGHEEYLHDYFPLLHSLKLFSAIVFPITVPFSWECIPSLNYHRRTNIHRQIDSTLTTVTGLQSIPPTVLHTQQALHILTEQQIQVNHSQPPIRLQHHQYHSTQFLTQIIERKVHKFEFSYSNFKIYSDLRLNIDFRKVSDSRAVQIFFIYSNIKMC